MNAGPVSADPVNAGPGDELVDIVDDADRVVRVVTRAEMRGQRLRHRAVFVAVVDHRDRVVVHQRAAWKDVWPSAWDLCFGGVVAAGESWSGAAARELAEEAGLHDVELTPLGAPFDYEDDAVRLVGRAYLVRSDAPVNPVDGEVAALDRVPRAELAAWAAQRRVCPDSLHGVLPALVGLTGPNAG